MGESSAVKGAAAALKPGGSDSAGQTNSGQANAVQAASSMSVAHYALTGVLTSGGPAYAWYHKSELAAGPPSPNAPPHSPGCSATSQYPVRTDWVPLDGTLSIDAAGAKLNHYSSLLAKVHGWLELANSPADASAR